MENYSLLMGAAAVMKMAVEMVAVNGEAFGHFPYMKDIVSNKRKIPNEEVSTMLANYSFNGKVPKKLGDPGTSKKIENRPKALTELYREVTNDDDRAIQRGKIRNIQLPAIRYFAYYLATSILGRENTSNISSYHLAFLVAALTGSTPYHLGALIARRLSSKGPIYGGIIASRIIARLGLSIDPNDEILTPVRLDIAAMKSHQFVTTDSNLENIVYRMLFIDGDEREIPLPQADLFSVRRRPWSRSKEEVDDQLRILGFHQQHDSEDAEPSDGYTVTYPGSFLDATISKSRQIENTETPNENAATPVNSPESVEYSSDDLDEDYVELDDDFIEKCNATTDARKIKSCLQNMLKRTPDDAEELLAKIGRNHDDWSTPEPTPTPIVKKRGMIKLNDEDMREAKKSLKEKGIKPEDVKNLPPIEDLCEITPPSSMIEYMKDIVTNKRKIPNEEISTMLANYSFNGKIPKKLGDPGAVIDCNKGMVTFNVDDKEHTVYFPKRIDKKRKMKKFKFGELFKKGTTSTGRPSRASTQIRRSYNEDIIAPSFAPEEDNGAPNASSFPCYDFLTNAGILDDFFTLVNRAGLATYVGDEREQYYRLTKFFVESFKFHNTQYEPTVAFKIYDNPVTMELEEFCRALDIVPVGTARRIDDNPRDLLELYRGITEDDCHTIQRGKIRNIQLPAIKYFAYYIATSILGRENTSNISSYHLAFLNAALTGETSYHLGSLIARRLSSRGPIFGGTIALRILTHLRLPLDSNDVPLTPRRLDIAAMKSHHFVTTDSTIDNMVYRMLFADGNEKEIPLPQPGLFNIDRQSWSLTKEEVEEHMKIQEFHQQHDSENAEPSYDCTVTYPDVSSSTYWNRVVLRRTTETPLHGDRGNELHLGQKPKLGGEDIQNSAAIAKPNLGTRNSVPGTRRDGELEEIIAIITIDASPSTIHDSPIHV
ncbi:hypothetical protein QYE76_055916 [Lolium multiflorum]|uniref:Arabidopsis retrotransposon Orf1 C-terminal domain-containing protein n=1 Tax=Lolium multiflorum TaxID=4521 RepID=A0AAD8T192_LOLMU|nr:hypothetical protein QYE76_055916 [Lolium multiflorum]